MPAKLTLNLDKINAAIRSGASEGLDRAAEKARGYLVEAMHESKSGRVYGSHQASAPGEAPATDTGELERSIQIDRSSPTSRSVYSDDPKAVMLELGTQRVAARPNFVTVAERMSGELVQIVAQALRERF